MRLTRRTALRAALGTLLAAPALHRARAAEAVSYLFPAPSFLPAFMPHHVAQKRGYFTSAGLEVTFQTGRGGADTAKQVAVGNADLGGGVGETTMIVRANGLPVRGVALLGGRPIFQVAARKAVGIKGFGDLRGRKVGVIGYQDTGYYALLGVLAASGLKRTDLQIQAVGAAGMTQLMIAGSLDAIMATPDWSDAIEQAGTALDHFPIDAVFPAMAQAVFASDQTVQRRPAVLRGFVGGLLHAVRDCMQDPAAAARDFVAAVPQHAGKEAEMERILRRYVADVYPTNPPDALGRFDAERLRTVQKFYVENSIIQTAVPVADLYTNDFVGQ
ncbi:ABC transporter substrate-binding protein [Roseomonas sp. NAR14]|uniref:ABC transporter substrate-binding protein n=1 Tax=Roseomonas acroporae TaxID=2937791 RepID=A0A9X1YDH9_9PROT|nr:ABC transporter substrate-binding protein [Roseomonas acroporae]MCK8784546.1 ABC transporter substrate-binding protein [Roseomonas acroporae]